MFRLIRLLFLLVVAFVAGFLYSEMTWQQRCADRGGETQDGICLGLVP